MNDNVYSRVSERVKEYNLTDQEIRAIETARRQMNSHTSVGGFIGATVAYFLGKKKRFAPLQVFAVAGGGFLIGSQLGLISGAMAGVRTINALPNPQRLISLVKDVQSEIISSRTQRRDPSAPRPSPPTQPHRAQSHDDASYDNNSQDEFSKDNYASHGGYNRLESEFESDNAGTPEPQQRSSWQNLEANARQAPQESQWDKIRSQNVPSNSWAKLRQEALRNPDAMNPSKLEQARQETARELQNRDSERIEELPRTREEAETRTPARRNQWGDLIE